MTLKDLHSEIKSLVFDDYMALDERVLASASRALQAVYNSRKITAERKFYVKNSLPKSKIPEIHHKGGGEESLPLSGKAFSMRLYGKGSIVISGHGGEVTKSFDCSGDVYRGFIDGDATLRLIGPLSFVVCDLVTFDELFSESAEDIPSGDGFTVIDLRKALPDFLTLEYMPTDSSGKAISGAVVYDGKIKIPDSFCGEISLVYRKRPILPSLDAPDAEIDIPAEYEALLPPYCASCLLLDDEPDMADLYREEYEKMLSVISRGFTYSIEQNQIETNGWA